MISNSLTLESGKVRGLRPGLDSLTNVGSFFSFEGQNQLLLLYNSLRSKLISKHFTCFPVKIVGIITIFFVDLNCKSAV